MATNQGFKSLVPRKEVADPKYLYHWLRCNRGYLQSLGNGATFKEISKAVVERIEIPLPPLVEQRRIAEILDRADALRAKRRQVLVHLDSLISAIYHDTFGDIGAAASGREEVPLGAWVDPARPITYGILKPGPDLADGIPYIRVADMKDGGIRVDTMRRTSPKIDAEYTRSRLRAGDLVMSIRGHVGRFATVPMELDGANITQDSARLAIASPDRALYVRATMEAPALQRWMARRTRGVAVRGINLGDLRVAPIPRAEDGEMATFAARARKVLKVRSSSAAQLCADNDLFNSLQGRAFRGEL
jgi:type I restriction enzyme S subunit